MHCDNEIVSGEDRITRNMVDISFGEEKKVISATMATALKLWVKRSREKEARYPNRTDPTRLPAPPTLHRSHPTDTKQHTTHNIVFLLLLMFLCSGFLLWVGAGEEVRRESLNRLNRI